MENASLVTLSKQMILRRQMAVIANNIANVSTVGFKRDRMLFTTVLKDIGGGRKAAFVKDAAVVHDPTNGPITMTGNPLDLAIQGEGYFQVETPDGIRYTRGGHFRLDPEGAIVTSSGYPVLGDDGVPILTIPGETNITITGDGTISTENGEIGRLAIMKFRDRNALHKIGADLYATDDQEGQGGIEPEESEDAQVVQGAVEESNVQPIIEMTRMITVMRSYQSAKRLIDDQDQIRRKAIRVLSGTQDN